jgi:aconitate hydratase
MTTFNTKQTLTVDGKQYSIYSLQKLAETYPVIHKLPFSLKVLLENLLRHEDATSLTQIQALIDWPTHQHAEADILFYPARILMQDLTGVPAIVDLAAMRDVLQDWGQDPQKINPMKPVDLVIDHSIMADYSGTDTAFAQNVDLEFQRNQERYGFLKWGQKALQNFRVVPPGTGICHQVNLEHLCQVVWTEDRAGETYAYPDTLLGTDSHTTMVNGLSVLGWGVGGIEAEASMLGEGLSMGIPDVVGVKLTGALQAGVTATDLVLTITHLLRQHGVVNKFVEFFGDGLTHLSLADRATLGNMAPEYGATCAFSPIDAETIRYLELTGRSKAQCALVQAYAQHQGLWWDGHEPVYTTTIAVDLGSIEPALAGPKRPQDKVTLSQVPASLLQLTGAPTLMDEETVANTDYSLRNGDVVIAAITSCTNTSNPSVMIGAGLLAQKAVVLGLTIKPWVKTSLAPGSQVVTDYLEAAGLQEPLNKLGFELIGYGCTTCIGNSGPLLPGIEASIDKGDLTVAAVLSGNRNFEGRIHRSVKASYLASPMLVVAYAIAGTVKKDLSKEPLAYGSNGQPVYLKDIWPTPQEIQSAIQQHLKPAMFQKRYQDVFKGEAAWRELPTTSTATYDWQGQSSYIKKPSFLDKLNRKSVALEDIQDAKILALFGDSITTDHISPAGSIKADSPAGLYLQQQGIEPQDFNSYGARRGNYEVMVRGTFANTRLQNEMVPDHKGGFTKHSGGVVTIYDAAQQYQQTGTPTVIIAGKEYGTGSSRDWAAKGTLLLGVRVVIAESFERIHRSNLVGMGVLPLQFIPDQTRQTLKLTGAETFTFKGLSNNLKPKRTISCILKRPDGSTETIQLLARIDTDHELNCYTHGGILPYVLRKYL